MGGGGSKHKTAEKKALIILLRCKCKLNCEDAAQPDSVEGFQRAPLASIL